MLEQFAEFAREMPAWCGADGMPLSWRHFVYGANHIRRAHAQETLRLTNAGRIAQASEDEKVRKFMNDLRIQAGFTR